MNTKNNDKFFMQQAIGLALKAKGNTSPNPVVGAVIVKMEKLFQVVIIDDVAEIMQKL
jgi:pyrimidine deaminase RibD-like protein